MGAGPRVLPMQFAARGEQQRAPRSCSPPLAADCAAQRAAEAVPCSPSHSVKFGLSPTPPSGFAAGRRGRRPKGRKSNAIHRPRLPGSSSARPHAPLMRRPRRGRRFRTESRYSLSTQSPAKSKAQSSPQFSVPYPPHCGSAIAPPVPLGTRKLGVSTPKRRPRQFLPDWPSANRQNMPSYAEGRRSFRERTEFFRAPARFILFRLTAEIVESLL